MICSLHMENSCVTSICNLRQLAQGVRERYTVMFCCFMLNARVGFTFWRINSEKYFEHFRREISFFK